MIETRLSVTNSLIIINVVVFVLGMFFRQPAILGLPIPGAPGDESFAMVLGSYSWFTCFMEGELWRLISYQFVHANVGHLIFNMWALYFFGPAVESVMGDKRFLLFYLVCGVAGALCSSLLAGLNLYTMLPDTPGVVFEVNRIAALVGYEGGVFPWQMVPLVGASAAVYGVMVATAFMYPHVQISLLFPPVTMKLRTFAIAIIALASATILFNWSNAGGEAGHLGGILMGAAIMYIWKLRLRARS